MEKTVENKTIIIVAPPYTKTASVSIEVAYMKYITTKKHKTSHAYARICVSLYYVMYNVRTSLAVRASRIFPTNVYVLTIQVFELNEFQIHICKWYMMDL